MGVAVMEAEVMEAEVAQTKMGESGHQPTPQDPWPRQGEWTYEDYVRLPDDGWKHEIIEGVLYMSPSPRTKHQRVIGKLFFAIADFLDQAKLGEVWLSPVDIILPNKLGTPVIPDLVYVAAENAGIVTEKNIQGVPDLVVEILSPSNWVDDRRVKYKAYAQAGVKEYWIIDPDQETVEIFVLGDEPGSYRLLERWERGQTLASQVLDGFTLTVDEVFGA